jgi:hypothetical protein
MQKGHVYRGNYQYFAEHVPGGLAAVLGLLPTDGMRRFFEQRFTPDQWYDTLPNVYLQDGAARLQGVSVFEQGRRIGAFHARARMTGLYRAMLKVLSNESVAIWAPRVSALYYSFGRLESRVVGPRRVSLRRAGVPVMMVPWIAATMTGVGEEMLTLAGAQKVRVSLDEATLEDTRSGYPLCRIEGEITWS